MGFYPSAAGAVKGEGLGGEVVAAAWGLVVGVGAELGVGIGAELGVEAGVGIGVGVVAVLICWENPLVLLGLQ